MNSLKEHTTSSLILGGGLTLAGALILAQKKYKDSKEREHLTSLRLRKQEEREEQFESLEEEFPFGTDSAEIVNLSFEDLQLKLQRRELKAKQVLEAYVAKALVVTSEFNCVTEFIQKSFEWADELDALPEVKGPLHGIPVCIKDDTSVEGTDSTLGLSVNLYKPKESTAVAVKILQEAGAIPFCKTNIPQTEFSYGSTNPIFGTTTNPLNKNLSPGGSSSGTGCLVGAGGALFGTGADIGGSVRIPAHFNGISTLKSTVLRVSGRGLNPCLEDSAGLTGVLGILANRAKTLSEVYKVLLAGKVMHEHDPQTVPIPWDSHVFESKEPLRIGYFTTLDYFPAIGDTPDTVLKAKAALQERGHTLVPFELFDPRKVMEVFASLSGADGGNQNYNKLKYDEVSYVAKKFTYGRDMSSYLCSKMGSIFGSKQSSRELAGNPECQRSEILWEYLAQVREIKNVVLDKMKQLKLDLILSPAFPFPATKLEDTDALMSAIVYTAYWNLVDFPAGVVPFGKESGTKVDEYDDQGDSVLKLAKKNARLATNMPIGVQIIGRPFHEEMVLRMLNELEESRPT